MGKFEQLPKHDRDVERDRRVFLEAIEHTTIQEIPTDFEEQSLNFLKQDLSSSQLFLLGETHGVKENPCVIYTLFKKFGFKKLALEWDKKLQKIADDFLSTGILNFDAIKESPDGRITAGHFALLKKLKEEGLLSAFVCFDEESTSDEWDARDSEMADNIIANVTDEATLVVAGKMHTGVEPIVFEDEEGEHHPMGEVVKKIIPSVPSGKINYLTGQFHNFGIRQFKQKPNAVKLSRGKFYKTTEGVYIFELPEAHPAVVPNPSDS